MSPLLLIVITNIQKTKLYCKHYLNFPPVTAILTNCICVGFCLSTPKQEEQTYPAYNGNT